VAFVDDCIGEKVEKAVAAMKDGDVVLLENVRYYNEEEANDPAFAEKLAKVADVYVNDAFGAAHRAHASTEGVARVVAKRGGKCAAGLLMERELKFLGDELENPARPFVVILGGAKVSDKIKVIDRLLEKADTILIGGAMAYTFRLAQGFKTGKSLVEPDTTDTALDALAKAKSCAGPISAAGGRRRRHAGGDRQAQQKGQAGHRFQNPHREPDEFPDDAEGFDIGPETPALRRNHPPGARPFCGTARWACLKTALCRRHQRRGAGRGRRHAERTAPRASSAAATA
jgi:phosphoglycerate kinase